MRTIKMTNGVDMALDGDLLSMLEVLYHLETVPELQLESLA